MSLPFLLLTAADPGSGLSASTTAALLLGAAAVVLYIAVRASADAVANWPVLSVTLAVAIPNIAGAALAVAAGFPASAITLVFAAAVATATLVLGLGLNTRADEEAAPITEPTTDASPVCLLAAAMAVIFAGFTGTLGPVAALLLLAAGGAVVLLAWPVLSTKAVVPAGSPAVMVAQLLLAACLAVAGVGLAGSGAQVLERSIGRQVMDVSATVLAAPMLALPMVGVVTRLGAQGRRRQVIAGTAVAAAALLGIVLPLVLGGVLVADWLRSGAEATWAVTLPLRLWRIDAVLLALVGLLLLPVAARRWLPGSAEGLALILLYVAYLVVSVAASR